MAGHPVSAVAESRLNCQESFISRIESKMENNTKNGFPLRETDCDLLVPTAL